MTPALESLAETLGARLSLVRLTPAPEGHSLLREPPAPILAWVSDYAWLILWPIGDPCAETIRAASATAEAFMDQALPPLSSTPGQVTDAYVVLVLDQPPRRPDDVEAVRHVRLERQVCRRTIVWPQDDGWHWVESLPLLPLPDGDTTFNGSPWPLLPKDQRTLIERLEEESQSGNPVAKADIEAVERAFP